MTRASLLAGMRPTLLSLAALLCALPCLWAVACSASSSPKGVAEAGVDATADATDESCFPFCGSGSSSSGGSMDEDGGDASCAQLKTQIEMLQGPAQACDPTKLSQCSGTAQGLCCPVTVTAGNDTAVNAFQEAVDSFKTMCDAGCLTPVCPTAPSLKCESAGTSGTCQ
jgi:hypothetical protein